MDAEMVAGMLLMVAGLVLAARGLVVDSARPDEPHHETRIRALDDARMGWAHVRLIAVLTAAVAIDTLKPYTLTFILPGVAREYGLSTPAQRLGGHAPVALLAFSGIFGTAIGSIIWGRASDIIGRRASILLSSLIFIASSACAAMPAFWENIVMCLIMGLAVGGLLPVAYSLLVETIPVSRRGEVVVLVAGVGTAAGFLLAAAAARWLMPLANWRVMWLLGIPTGLILIVLNRAIPESPRFLIARGRLAEAGRVLQTFGAEVVALERLPEPVPAVSSATETSPGQSGLSFPDATGGPRTGFHQLWIRPYTGLTLALTIYGLAWGIVSFGFIVWLPTYLLHAGLGGAYVTTVISEAAVFAVPGAVLASRLYRRSARTALVLFAAATALSLSLFAAFGKSIISSTPVLVAVLVLLLVSMWGAISVLGPYSAEVYPTLLRSSGSGVAAFASKAGGVLALAMALSAVAPPGLAGAAILCTVPMLLAAVAVVLLGVETAGHPLDAIQAGKQRPVLVSD